MTDPVRGALVNITAQIGYDKIKDLVAEIRQDGWLSGGRDREPLEDPLKSDDEYVLEVKEIFQFLLNAGNTIDRVTPRG